MKAGYKRASSKLLAAVLALLMVFGNVASPVSGAFSVYATDENAVVNAETEALSEEAADEASAEEQLSEEAQQDQDTTDQGAAGESEDADSNTSADAGADVEAAESNAADENDAEDAAAEAAPKLMRNALTNNANSYSWADLKEAIENGTDAEIVLPGNISAEGTIVVSRKVKLTSSGASIFAGNNKTMFEVRDGGELTLGEGLTLSGLKADCTQGCDSGNCNIVTKDDINGTSGNPKGFFVEVNSGKFILDGAILEDFRTSRDKYKTPKFVAPVAVNGSNSSFNIISGEIRQNIVGYIADDSESKKGGNEIKIYVKGQKPNAPRAEGSTRRKAMAKIDNGDAGSGITGTAGAIAVAGGASGSVTGGKIEFNRADTGGIMVTGDGSFVKLKDGTDVNNNVGFQFGGGATVENGGAIYMDGGSINNNVAWFGGGAVYATQNGVDWLMGNQSLDERTDGYFTLAGGELSNNNAFTRGGAILVDSNGVSLKGGNIHDNTSRVLGGAAYVMGDEHDFSYTLFIGEGEIYNNMAINKNTNEPKDVSGGAPVYTNARLSAALKSVNDCDDITESVLGEAITTSTDDITDFGGVNDGTGGGIWSCPFGSTILDFQGKVSIHDNYAQGNTSGNNPQGHDAAKKRNSESEGGNDLHSDNGGDGRIVMEPAGVTNWRDENTEKDAEGNYAFYVAQGEDGEIRNLTYDGEIVHQNGVQIYNNASRRGGGLASNGTFVFADKDAVARLQVDMNVEKSWEDGVDKKPINIRINVKDGNKTTVVQELKLDGTANGNAETDEIYEHDAKGNTWSGGFKLPLTVENEDGELIPVFKFEDNAGIVYDPSDRDDMVAFAKKLANGYSDFKVSSDSNLYIEELVADGNNYIVTSEYKFIISEEIDIRNFEIETSIQGSSVGPEGEINTTVSLSFGKVLLHTKVDNKQPEEPATEKYINGKVHEEVFFDEEFEYEILAYIPKDATSAVINDKLSKSLEVKDTSKLNAVYILKDNNHIGDGENGTVVKPTDKEFFLRDVTEAVNRGANGTKLEITDSLVKLTLGEDFLQKADDAVFRNEGRGLNGVWVMLSYTAKYRETFFDMTKVKASENGWLDEGDGKSNGNNNNAANGFVRDAQERHEGTSNEATYSITGGHFGDSDYTTNIVTVKPKTTKLTVKKTWANGAWPKNNPKVTFGVFLEGKEEPVETVDMDKDTPDSTIVVDGLPLFENGSNKYTAREIRINGKDIEYDEAKEAGAVIIEAINNIKYVVEMTYNDEKAEYTAKNKVDSVQTKINKTDLGGKEIEGATIVVYDSEGNEVKSWKSEKDKIFDLMLEPGSYTFKETVAPEGYECVETNIEFTVDEDGNVTVEEIDGVLEQLDDGTMVLKDTPIRKISKNELGGSEIEGAEMTLTMPDGTVKEWISSAEEAYEFAAVTGTYKLKEVTPPSDYTQVTTEIEFTVDDHGNITLVTTEVNGGGKISVNGDTVVLEDAPKKEVNIAKTDLGGEELKGATITVTGKDNAGNEVKETWESETTAHTLKLDPGTYTMEEKAAPAGYQCVETKIQFSVDADGKVTVEEIDGVLEQLDDGTIILKDAPEKPAIEKYVNKKTDNLSDTERDGTVHYDLSAFNEVYTYDIQAYITADATIVEVNDELKEVLEFVGDAPTSVVVKDGEGQSKAVAPKLTKAGEAVDYTIDEDAWDEGKLILTIGSDAEDAPKLYPNGKWLQITFDAKIKDKYKSLEAIKAADGVFTEITVNEEIDDADVNATFSGAEVEAHEGIVNDSSYRIKSKVAALNVNVDNEWAYGVKSNTVTVVPPTTEVSFSKTDLEGKELPGAEMALTDAEGNVIDKWTSTTENHILNLADGEYIMTEKAAPEGYYCVTTEMHFEVKDGEVTLKTAVVDNDGEIEVLAGTHIILKDAPKVQSEYEEKKDEGDEGEEEVVEKRVPEKSHVKEAYSARVNTGDDSALYIWAVMLMISLAAIAVTIIRRRRTN